ncbi:MAG: putative toxin-antitoxin system toxin component, PIN family [Proteobacteria bacterium]|nr:putative toxin-antitoxin system toxin component, PIN family [Pseudomonadota bacterium]
MLVVLDTNIIISGLYSKRGASYQLLKAAISGDLPCAISPLIALEYEGKIHDKIEEGFLRISKWDCGKILDALFAMAKVVWKPFQIRPVLSDPSDDKILECAISSDCTHIITFNTKHFSKVVTRLYGIQPVSPRKFLKLWRDKP